MSGHSGVSDEEHELQGFVANAQSTQAIRHVSPPPEDDFEFSRDKAEETAHASLRNFDCKSTQTVNVSGHQSQSPETVDVLERHQQKNGCPHAPNPAMLTALHDQSMAMAEKDDNSDEGPPCKCCTCC
ncbi:hypothetical protein SCLCIDRAFT_34082 [Scleroderma citrinum Foug A]|uniref:Uncharacterized protein n=1 Tax=Scleroderma citrinum Foug A TaxID=1036808 RepID=A0A0C3CQ44_9AGAM|nr:hypothetical protein SCLCIDRAFT_34082 [Scleroderma citrinum Foug A]